MTKGVNILSNTCVRCGGENEITDYHVCPDCLAPEDYHERIVHYLMTHRTANALDVARDTGVPVSTVLEMINNGHLRSKPR
jgi:reverse gyrase